MSGRQDASNQLRGGALGLPQVLFQAIAHMGPANGIAFALLFGFIVAGPTLPLSAIFGLIAVVLVASSVGQLAKHMPSAGGLYSYVSNSLGLGTGFIVGWAFLIVELLVPLGYSLSAGLVMQDMLSNEFGISDTWWIWTAASVALFAYLNYRSVELSTNALLVLGVTEILIVLALVANMIFAAGGDNTLAVFNSANAEGNWSATFKGMVFVILACQGFETAAPLGEEARNPRRIVPRAVVLSAIIVGIFYIVATYGTVMGWGFDQMASYGEHSNPWGVLARQFWGIGWIFLFLAIVNSVVAGGNAGTIGSSRTLYALGRNRVFPGTFGRTHPAYQTPHIAVLTVSVAAGALALVGGAYWGPQDALGIFVTTLVLFALLVYIITCIACPVYYVRSRRAEFNPFLHAVVPVAGVLVMLVPLYFQFNPLPDYPILWGTWFALGLLIVGLAVLIVLSLRRPHALRSVRQAFIESEE